jgi:micrococcal nuclease
MLSSFFNLLVLFASFTINAKVISVTDGDTIQVMDANKVTYKIRLENIDAPEKGQAYYNNSKQFLLKKLKGQQVNCIVYKKDRYGRWLATVFNNGININTQMVSTGNAWAYLYNKNVAIKNAQLAAQKQLIGIWALPNPIAPWLYRKQKRTH